MSCPAVTFALLLVCPPSPPPEPFKELFAPHPREQAAEGPSAATPADDATQRRHAELAEAAGAVVRPRVFVSCLRAGGATDAEEPAEEPDAASEDERADRLAATAPPVVNGEGVLLICRLKNVGDAPIGMTQTTDPMMDLALHVVGPGEMKTPLTLYGQLNGYASGSRLRAKLAPGRTDDRVVELSRRYDVSLPGEYRVWFTRDVILSGVRSEPESDPVRFAVDP